MPEGFWLRGVCPEFEEKDTKKILVSSMHFINGEGRLVCDCAGIHPSTSDVYPAWNVPRENRWLYCADSVTYLRRIVRKLQEKESGK